MENQTQSSEDNQAVSETAEFLADIIGTSNSQTQQQNQQPETIDSPSFFGEEFTDWGKVKTEIPQRLQKLQQLEQEVTQLKSAPLQYANEEIGEFDSFVKNTTKKDWGLFQKVKSTESLEGLDALVFKTVFENPELAGKEDAVKAKIVSDYKIDPDINDVESVEFTMNKKKMEQDAVEAKNWFQDLKGKVKVQSQSPEEMQQKKAEKVGQWKTAVQEVLGQVTKIPIPVWDGKEVKIIGDYEIKEDNRSVFIDPLTQAFASYELDDSNRRVVGQEFQERFIARNLPYIIDSAIKLKEAEIRSQIEAEYGGSIRRPNPPGGGGSTSGDDFENYLNS
jgi:hypothetical protein